MKYIGSERWESKKGTVGYNIYLIEECNKERGVGNRFKMVYQGGYSRIPSTDAEHWNDIFRTMKVGQVVTELYLNERGYIVGCALPQA